MASVQLGRRGRNDRVVSQDLEIWLTTQEVSGERELQIVLDRVGRPK